MKKKDNIRDKTFELPCQRYLIACRGKWHFPDVADIDDAVMYCNVNHRHYYIVILYLYNCLFLYQKIKIFCATSSRNIPVFGYITINFFFFIQRKKYLHFLITCQILKYILKRLVVEFLTLHHLHILNAIYKQYKIRYLEEYYNYGNEILCKTIFQYIMSKYKKKVW